MRNFVRGFIAIWYLLGWISHVYLALFSPQTYAVFGRTAWIQGYDAFWQGFIMPRITFFALLLAAFEILVGLLLINRGKWVKYGLALSIAFNLFLIQMGLGTTGVAPMQDFLMNRLPNLIFLGMQIPMFWGTDELTLLQAIQSHFKRSAI